MRDRRKSKPLTASTVLPKCNECEMLTIKGGLFYCPRTDRMNLYPDLKDELQLCRGDEWTKIDS